MMPVSDRDGRKGWYDVNVPPPRRNRGRVAWVNALQLQADAPLTGARVALDVPEQQGMSLPWEQVLGTLAEHTAAMLEALGATVFVTVGDLGAAATEARTRMVADFGANLLICLRVGKAPSTHVRGLGAHVVGWNLMAGRRLASHLLNRVGQRTGSSVRGTSWKPWLQGYRPLRGFGAMPTVLFECGCISSPADEELLRQESWLVRCARGLTEGVMLYRDLPEHRMVDLSLFEAEVKLFATPVESQAEPVRRVKGRIRLKRTVGTDTAVLAPALAVVDPLDPEPVVAPAATDSESGRPEEPAGAPAPVEPVAPPVSVQQEAQAVGVTGTGRSTRHAEWQARNRQKGHAGGKPLLGQSWVANGLQPPPLQEGTRGQSPEAMIPTKSGWISPRAAALMQQHQMDQPSEPEVPRVDREGRIHWPSLPPEFTRGASRRFEDQPEQERPLS